MASNEDLEQRIVELESMVVSSYDPPSGPEYSFPAPGQPIDQNQFQLLSLTDGNGIIDRGDGPYRLVGWESNSETNQKNSMLLTVGRETKRAEAVVSGYYHVITQDMEISLPPVSTPTTYYICLTYDPRIIDEGGGPGQSVVSVQVYKDEVPTTGGRVNVVTHSVSRKANQLLTDADMKILRPRVSPLNLVGSLGSLPSPSSVLYGTMALAESTNDIVVARNAESGAETPSEWVSVTSPEWTDLQDNQYYGWPGHGHRRGYRRLGSSMEIRGRIKRIDGQKFQVGGGDHDQGYRLIQLPGEFAPKDAMRFVTATDGYHNNKLVIISIESDGSVYGMPLLDNASWIGIDGIRFDTK